MPGTPRGDSQIDMIIFRSPLVHILSLGSEIVKRRLGCVFGCPCCRWAPLGSLTQVTIYGVQV